MAEDLIIDKTQSKAEKYETVIPQIESLVRYENDVVANMSNIAAALKETFDFLWVGFYTVKGEELVLGPFQGPVACTRIKKGKGVCGTSWQNASTILVEDVEAFPGHIACSSASKSEIVVPVIHNKQVVHILDVDSATLSDFDATDQEYLEILVQKIGKFI